MGQRHGGRGVRVSQRVGDRRFASILQLLEDDRGQPLVRMAYTTDGVTRRGPVTLRPKDVEKLRSALKPGSALAAALGCPVSDGSDGRRTPGARPRRAPRSTTEQHRRASRAQRFVGRAEQRVDGVLRMRHQPEHVPGLVADAGHVADRAVRVLAGRVAEEDLAFGFELREQLRVGEPAALAVLDRDRERLARLAPRR